MMKISIVDHAYQDHSQDLAVNFKETVTNKKLIPTKIRKIISSPEYQYIISWKPHGRVCTLVNKSLFISVILEKHFIHLNFGSCNRSVNGWGLNVCSTIIFPLHHHPIDNMTLIHVILHTSPCEGGAWPERILPPPLSTWQLWADKYDDSFNQSWEMSLQVSIIL